jgi:hypothetical protein
VHRKGIIWRCVLHIGLSDPTGCRVEVRGGGCVTVTCYWGLTLRSWNDWRSKKNGLGM